MLYTLQFKCMRSISIRKEFLYALKLIKVMVKTCIMLQKIPISNKI